MCTGKSESEDNVGKLINIVSHQLRRQMCCLDGEDGLTNIQKHVLHYILLGSLKHEIYQKDLEREFQIRRSTATGTLQLLEKNGFIRREPEKKDARLKKIIPTEKTQNLQKGILDNIRYVEEKMMAGIPEKDLMICAKVLNRMSANLLGEERKKGDRHE